MTGFEVVPIGWVESPLTERAQAPRQGDEGAPDAWLVFEPRVAEGIRAIVPGTEIIVLTWLDRADRGVLVTRRVTTRRGRPPESSAPVPPTAPIPSGCTGSRSSPPRDCGSWSGPWKPWTRRPSST
jgi:hypothetical protein